MGDRCAGGRQDFAAQKMRLPKAENAAKGACSNVAAPAPLTGNGSFSRKRVATEQPLERFRQVAVRDER
ncbi:MAG: hypothetical protein M4D80_17710 [Myxococcota bacterium]|nr:hypothetical protein [Myxococcota bacterium]